MTISFVDVLIRLLAATLVGCLFGRERRRRLKPVGMRTHVLICLSCTIITMISAYGFGEHHQGDPARLMVGVLTGIGFIGGGIIWKNATGMVQGVTTAANIFLLTALSMAIGLGLYFMAGAATVIGFLTLEGDHLKYLWKKGLYGEPKTCPADEADHQQGQEQQGQE